MRRTKRSKSKIIVGILSSIVLVLTIGYSFLSLNLRISGLAHIGAVWNIHFDNITINPDSVSLSSGDIEPGIDEDNDCKINYKVTLSPGDFYEFTFDIVNDGTIDGMIQNMITRIEEDATATLPNYIDYTVSYSDDAILETNQQLLAGTTETLKVKVEFLDEENVPQTETLDLSYENNYTKKTNSATEVIHPQPLYDVFSKSNLKNYVLKYTGQHHDSFTEEPSKDLYYFSKSYGTSSSYITNSINVLFANHCWQMLRTTDTGGIKLLYNGEAENNQCLDNRNNHPGYNGKSNVNLNSNYWYGTEYTYDPINKVFSIAGTKLQATWNNSTYTNLLEKYTCRSTLQDGTCGSLYYVYDYSSNTSGSVLTIDSNSNYSIYGILPYSNSTLANRTLTFAGYKYGDVYSISNFTVLSSETFTNYQSIAPNHSSSYNYWMADSVTYDNGLYSLVNPQYYNTPSDLSSNVGKYTMFSSTNSSISSANVYYIVGNSSSNYYYMSFTGGSLASTTYISIGNNVVDNQNGTFTLDGVTNVPLTSWVTDFQNYMGKYICDNLSSSCTQPYYLHSSTSGYYYYGIPAYHYVFLGKNRENLTLTDTVTIRFDQYVLNYSDYSDYIYKCQLESSLCTESSLRIIKQMNSTDYSYVPNRYYGSSVTWDGEKYTLVDTVGLENYRAPLLTNHHYFCSGIGQKSCSTVNYFYYAFNDDGPFYYITLANGDKIKDGLSNMLEKNTKDSLIKIGIEAWYEKYLLNYDQYIEDTIYCDDRTIKNNCGWKENGGLRTSLLFGQNSLLCDNVSDQFSTLNDSAKTKYKIGLATRSEMSLSMYSVADTWKKPKSFHLMNPYGFTNFEISFNYLSNSGSVASNNDNNGIAPVISLIPGIKYTDGDGSKENPYIIKTN